MTGSSQPYEVSITTKEMTVDDRIKQMKQKIKEWNGSFTMSKSMEDCHSIYMVVITFLSLLDMVHDGTLTFKVRKDDVYFVKGAAYE